MPSRLLCGEETLALPNAISDGPKKKRRAKKFEPSIIAKICDMQREASGTNRVTADEAYQRIKRDLELRKDWRQLLLLTVQRVQQVMSTEWASMKKEAADAKKAKEALAKAAQAPTPVPLATGEETAHVSTPQNDPPTVEEMSPDEVAEVDFSLNDCIAARHAMRCDADD